MLTVRIDVEDPAAILSAFGAGALGRVESSATQGGTYAEVATFAITTATAYSVAVSGAVETWYRSRYSTAAPGGPSDYSDYSAPFMATAGGLLTVAQLRNHVTSALPDAALQRLLDAAEAAIVEIVGAPGPITEYVNAWAEGAGYSPWGLTRGLRLISVSRPIGTVSSVTEYIGAVGDPGVVLDATDYRASGYVLSRLPAGTHPRWDWGQRVTVVYAPADETADRERVQIELVRLDLNARPGLALQMVEGFEERYSGAGLLNYSQERADLLASLGSAAAGRMVVVGDDER